MAEPAGGVVVVPATADRFGDVAAVLNPRGHPVACWCIVGVCPAGSATSGLARVWTAADLLAAW